MYHIQDKGVALLIMTVALSRHLVGFPAWLSTAWALEASVGRLLEEQEESVLASLLSLNSTRDWVREEPLQDFKYKSMRMDVAFTVRVKVEQRLPLDPPHIASLSDWVTHANA